MYICMRVSAPLELKLQTVVTCHNTYSLALSDGKPAFSVQCPRFNPECYKQSLGFFFFIFDASQVMGSVKRKLNISF